MDWDEILAFSSRRVFWAGQTTVSVESSRNRRAGRAPEKHTFREVIFDLEVGLVRDGQIQRGHGVPLRLAGGPRPIVGRHCVLAGYRLEGGRRGSRRAGRVLQHDGHDSRRPEITEGSRGATRLGAREPQIRHRSGRRCVVHRAVRLRRSPGMERRGIRGARGTICT